MFVSSPLSVRMAVQEHDKAEPGFRLATQIRKGLSANRKLECSSVNFRMARRSEATTKADGRTAQS